MSDEPTAEPAPPPAGPVEPVEPGGYRNLWVPLIVVPFLVVGVIALVFVFFGAIRGDDATLEENLRTMVEGGTNERKQAAMSLVAQVVRNEELTRQGKPPEWKVGPDFLERLQRAWEDMREEDNLNLKLVLASVLASYGDPDARERLEELLVVPDADDADGQVRFGAMEALARLGDPAAAPAVIRLLDHPDPYLQLGAAAALQALPGPASVEALRGLLGEDDLALRGMAAISLSHLGDDAGHAVLVDLVDPATYAAVHALDPDKYADPKLVQHNRISAIEALTRLALPEDAALFARLAEEEPDPEVREAAMRGRDALAGAERAPAGGGS